MQNLVQYARKTSQFVDSLGVETKGIHRYLPNERNNEQSIRPYISTLGLWISGCGGLTAMSSFFLGPLLFGLGYKDTLICGILGLLLGCLFAAYCATMGPRSGLRQMCSSRYLFGPWMVRIVGLITIIGFLGWSVTNSVLGGEILKWLSGGKLSLSVGVIIVCIVSLVVALFGIEYIMMFEGFIGIFVMIVVLLLYIISGKEYTQYTNLPTIGTDSLTKIGNRISFFTLAYSTTTTWGGCASDYYVVFPENVPQSTIFVFTFFSIGIPSLFSGVIGMLIGNAAVGNKLWNDTYEEKSLGGLLNLVFDRWGNFGKFLLVILWLSLITNNIINTYSSALSVQLLDDLAYRYLPRWFIVIIIFAITLVCSLVGRDHFSSILSNFLPMLGYWVTIYFILLLEENVIFRSTRLVKLFRKELYEELYLSRLQMGEDYTTSNDSEKAEEFRTVNNTVTSSNGLSLSSPSTSSASSTLIKGNTVPPFSTVSSVPYYNFEAWNDKYVLTNGIAAVFAFCCGVAGAVVGMNQVYYVGPIAKIVGEYHADLGVFLAMGFAGLSYPPARYIELLYFKK